MSVVQPKLSESNHSGQSQQTHLQHNEPIKTWKAIHGNHLKCGKTYASVISKVAKIV